MRPTSCSFVSLLLPFALALSGCAEGTIPLEEEKSSGDSSKEKETAAEEKKESDAAKAKSARAEDLGDEDQAFALTSDEDGWVDQDDNELGVQGEWSLLEDPNSMASMTLAGVELCLSGQTAQVAGDPADYVTNFGAGAALELCQKSAEDDGMPLAGCPWSSDLDKTFAGVRFTVEGLWERELRVRFKEEGRDDAAYVVVPEGQTGAVEVIALVKDAEVFYNGEAAPVDPRKIHALEIIAHASSGGVKNFDFCISKLEVLTGTGWKPGGEVGEWILEDGPGQQVDYVGVNLSSAEFGEQNLPGVYDSDYVYPDAASIDYYADVGMNVIRLPFRWERVEQELGAEFDATELAYMDDVVRHANSRSMSVILSPHNFGRHGVAENIIGESDVTIEDFANFWGQMAQIYGDNDQVIIGLMNEPHDQDTDIWLSAANAAIAAIRDAGATNLILVPGNAWTGAHNWSATYYGTPNSEAMAGVVDSGDNFAFELHQYLDSDSSGSSAQCVSDMIGVDRMTGVTDWLREGGFRGFLGEFGGGPNDVCMHAVDEQLKFVGENSDVWMGWAVWAGGPWWNNYFLSVEPDGGEEKVQMSVLKRHMDAP